MIRVPRRSLPALERAIIRCNRCSRLRDHCERVARERRPQYADQPYWGRPVPGFGDPRARLLLVGLAPGAHGSNRTGRMFTGDASGEWLFDALHRFGFANRPDATSRDDRLVLTDCFITAAARCAPPGNRPTAGELDACRPFLVSELALMADVLVVMPLGRIGFDAWLRAAGWWDLLPAPRRPRFGHGVEAVLPDGTHLIGSYHPSRQNTNTGKLTRAMWHGVFRRVRALLDAREPLHGSRGIGVGTPRRQVSRAPRSPSGDR